MGFPQKMIHLHAKYHPPQGFTVENANIKQLEEFEESSTSETEVFHLRESMSVFLGLAKMAKMEMHLHSFLVWSKCDNETARRPEMVKRDAETVRQPPNKSPEIHGSPKRFSENRRTFNLWLYSW